MSMELASLQRRLLELVTTNGQVSDADDAYICIVANSPQLAIVREIVSRWRTYDVRRTCVLTSTLLERRILLDEAVRVFGGERGISPFVESLGAAFLERMSGHEDQLVAEVARFELALIRAKRGNPDQYVVDWDRDPYAVLGSLLGNTPIEEMALPGGRYRTIISCNFRDLFVVEQISDERLVLPAVEPSAPTSNLVSTTICGRE